MGDRGTDPAAPQAVDEVRKALALLVEAITPEVNEKGAGGYLLARLTDAQHVLASTSESAPAPAGDEAAQVERVERVARAALAAEARAMASVAKAVGLPEDVDAEAIVHQVHELVAALAALKEGQQHG